MTCAFTRDIPLRIHIILCLSWTRNHILFTPLVRSKHAKYLPKPTDPEVIICYCNRNCGTSYFHCTTPQECAAFWLHVDRCPGVELERAQLRFPETACSFLYSQMIKQVSYVRMTVSAMWHQKGWLLMSELSKVEEYWRLTRIVLAGLANAHTKTLSSLNGTPVNTS